MSWSSFPAPRLIPMGGRGRILLFCVVPDTLPEGFGHRTAYALTVKAGSRLARIAKVAGFLWRDIAHVAAYPADAEIIAHEAVHLWQCYRECNGSWLRYLWRYWRLLRRHGREAHPWEVEARALAPTMARQLADAFTDL
jgi:hypothetical protein